MGETPSRPPPPPAGPARARPGLSLVTALFAKSHKPGPAVLTGVVTVCLLFAAIPAIGPAVTSGTAEFARQLGDATTRAATVPQEATP